MNNLDKTNEQTKAYKANKMDGYSAKELFDNKVGFAYDDIIFLPGFIDFLLQDINLDVVVELGRTRKPLRDILAFTPGNVIELNSMVGDSVDVLINDRLIAKGEVVAFEERLGVRITSIVTPEDLIKKTMK